MVDSDSVSVSLEKRHSLSIQRKVNLLEGQMAASRADIYAGGRRNDSPGEDVCPDRVSTKFRNSENSRYLTPPNLPFHPQPR